MILHDIRAKLSPTQYIQEICEKTQIVLHHTVGSGNPFNTVYGWNTTPIRVGTAIVIAGREDNTKSYKDGQIFEAFPLKFHASHVNVRTLSNTARVNIEKRTIGIELCNYGQLTQINGKFYALGGKLLIPNNQVVDLGFVWRGSRFYHDYTDAQIESLRELLPKLCTDFNIPKKYCAIFDVNQLAIRGVKGIYTHSDFRADKSDIAPIPKIVKLLKSL